MGKRKGEERGSEEGDVGGREKKDGKATTTCRVAVYTCARGFTHVHIHNSSHVELGIRPKEQTIQIIH